MRKYTYMVHFKEFLKLFKYLASSGIHAIARLVGSPLRCSSTREKEKKGKNSHKAFMGILSSCRSPPIDRDWVCELFTKTFIIMFISTNVQRRSRSIYFTSE